MLRQTSSDPRGGWRGAGACGGPAPRYGNGLAPSSGRQRGDSRSRGALGRVGARRSTFVVFTLGVLAGVTGLGVGCRGSRAPTLLPVPVLAATPEAQIELRGLELAWDEATREERAALEDRLRRYLTRYPNDDGGRLIRVYLALIVGERGERDAAAALLEPVASGPAGAVRDLAAVVAAAQLARDGAADEAVRRLRLLAGKLIGASARGLFAEHLARAATTAGQFAIALEAMEEWLAVAAPAQRREAQLVVARLLESCPKELAEATALALDRRAVVAPREPTAAARDHLRRALRQRLLQEALADRDTELAQRLIARSPAASLPDGEGEALAALAATGTVSPRIVGRTLGVVLSLSTSSDRRRSAALVAGVSRALRSAHATASPVRLTTRDDGGDPEAMATTLAALAGDGASLLIAGVDPEGAERARRYAETGSIPVLLPSPPVGPVAADGASFVVGIEADAVVSALREALSKAGVAEPPVVVGPGGLACDVEGTARLAPLPFADWRRARTPLLLLGEGVCVREVFVAARAGGHQAPIGVGLEGAEGLVGLGRTGLTLVARAGRFPPLPAVDPTLSLYRSLGHDAARLAAAALEASSVERFEGARDVTAAHRQVRERLAWAEAELQSTDARGFAGGRVLQRRIVVAAIDGSQEVRP